MLTPPLQNLDIQYTVGLATSVPTTYVAVGTGVILTNNLMDELVQLLQQDEVPLVLTTSYVFQEHDQSRQLSTCVG